MRDPIVNNPIEKDKETGTGVEIDIEAVTSRLRIMEAKIYHSKIRPRIIPTVTGLIFRTIVFLFHKQIMLTCTLLHPEAMDSPESSTPHWLLRATLILHLPMLLILQIYHLVKTNTHPIIWPPLMNILMDIFHLRATIHLLILLRYEHFLDFFLPFLFGLYLETATMKIDFCSESRILFV
jgi:hypothetical protein